MVSATCTLLFAAAALAALTAMLSTWRTYGADVFALRTLRFTTAELQLSWRILPSSWQFADEDLARHAPIKALLAPVKAGLPQDPTWQASLAA